MTARNKKTEEIYHKEHKSRASAAHKKLKKEKFFYKKILSGTLKEVEISLGTS